MRDIQQLAQQRLAQTGSPALVDTSSILPTKVVDAYLQATVVGFEYPRPNLPDSVQFVGPLLPLPASVFSPPGWWDELGRGRPVVHITQGTLDNADLHRLLIPAGEALGGEDLLVVATTGGPDPAPLRPALPPMCGWSGSFPTISFSLMSTSWSPMGAMAAFNRPWPTASPWWSPATAKKSLKWPLGCAGRAPVSISAPGGPRQTRSRVRCGAS